MEFGNKGVGLCQKGALVRSAVFLGCALSLDPGGVHNANPGGKVAIYDAGAGLARPECGNHFVGKHATDRLLPAHTRVDAKNGFVVNTHVDSLSPIFSVPSTGGRKSHGRGEVPHGSIQRNYCETK